MMSEFYLYLFKHETESRFKIGVSVNPNNRLAKLPDSIDVSKSLIAKCLDRDHMYKIEKTLHFMFREHRLNNLVFGDGYTEWFSGEALPELMDFCTREKKRLGLTSEFTALPVLRSGVLVKKSYREDVRNANEQNYRCLASFRLLLTYLDKEKVLIFGRYVGLDGKLRFAVDNDLAFFRKYNLSKLMSHCSYISLRTDGLRYSGTSALFQVISEFDTPAVYIFRFSDFESEHLEICATTPYFDKICELIHSINECASELRNTFIAVEEEFLRGAIDG